MAFFSRDRGKEVPKRVPPDKSAGAWPSVQENTTGTGNFGKSSCGGTNAENQSLQAQENPREHSVVANQEDIPTGERSPIDACCQALTAWRQALTAWNQAITALGTEMTAAMTAAMTAWSPEVDSKEHVCKSFICEYKRVR